MNRNYAIGFFLFLTVLFCSSANAQAWETIFHDADLEANVSQILSCPGPDKGVRLTSRYPVGYVYSFDKLGSYLGKNTIPLTTNWIIMNTDKTGASYWTGQGKVRKVTADYQLAWTYSPADATGILSDSKPAPIGAGCFQYTVAATSEKVIDYVGTDGQLINRFQFPNNEWPKEYHPGNDSSLIYTNDFHHWATPDTVHWVKVNQDNQIVWERILNGDFYFYRGALDDGSVLCFNVSTCILMKINASGMTTWQRDLKSFFPGVFSVYLHDLLVREDGSVVLCTEHFKSNKKFISFINMNLSNGTALWIRSTNPVQQSTLVSLSWQLSEMSDGGILAAFSLMGSIYDDQILLMRTDPDGVLHTSQIYGKIYQDHNLDCDASSSENGLPQFSVIAQSGTKTYSATAEANGNFAVGVSGGNYNISVVQPGTYWEFCNLQTPVQVGIDHDSVPLNIGASASFICPEMFVSIGCPVLRRCFDNEYLVVQYANHGTAPATNAYVTITLEPELIYQSASVPLLSQNGQTYTFDIGTVDIEESGTFSIFFKVDCDAELGQVLCINSHIYPDSICIPTAANNASNQICRPVVASYDPNDKTAFVNGKPETNKILPDASLEYLIRFQNTGTDTAFNIIVEDTLSSSLDPGSIVPGASSHPYTFDLRDGRVLRFIFKQIMLPDSNINEPASHGFVKFSIRQAPENPLGSTLNNTAAITFDYNEPVFTNTSSLVISNASDVKEQAGIKAKTWPVPAHEWAEMLLPADAPSIESWRLSDVNGRTLRSGSYRLTTGLRIQRSGLPAGVYWCWLKLEDGQTVVSRIVFD